MAHKKDRAGQLWQGLGELSARLGLFQQAAAARLGLGLSDYRCLELILRAGREQPVTAGLLAGSAGLTTGAITGVLDRLERAGFVRREKDPQDRRQVLVRALPEREAELAALFAGSQRAWQELCARYGEEALALLLDFSRGAGALLEQEAAALQAEASGTAAEGEEALSAPLGAALRGRLELHRGAESLLLSSTAEAVLYRARFPGAAPKITARDGRVTIDPARPAFRLFDWRRKEAEIALHQEIPWSISVRGGASRLRGELSGLRLTALEISGGAHEVSLRLPAPSGTVPVRVAGGAHRLSILRPAGAAARLLVSSGANGLRIDTLRLGAVGGETRWESPEFAGAADRYDIEIQGGAHALSLAAE